MKSMFRLFGEDTRHQTCDIVIPHKIACGYFANDEVAKYHLDAVNRFRQAKKDGLLVKAVA